MYLNASLLGLRKQQVDERLDDILAFADIGEFVQQPLKAYSSGMAVRLAFAVMANVDADILVVDEALSVGDAFYTQKCMRFVHRFREPGSLLLVSHDTTTMASVCDKAILLNGGRIKRIGSTKAITEEYVKNLYEHNQQPSNGEAPADPKKPSPEASGPENWLDYRKDRINNSNLANMLEITQFPETLHQLESFGTGRATLRKVSLRDAASGQPLLVGLGGKRVQLRIVGQAHATIQQPIIGFILKNQQGVVLLGDNTNNMFGQHRSAPVKDGSNYTATFEFTLPLLPAGNYSITASSRRNPERPLPASLVERRHSISLSLHKHRRGACRGRHACNQF